MPVEMHKCKNHEAWLKHRKKYIGGSDVACILGLNPWKTNVQLFKEKKGLLVPDDLSGNEAVEYGTQVEEHIRAIFALNHPELEVSYVPYNSWHNTEYPFLAASLDGWSREKATDRKGIVECKSALITNQAQAEKWKDNHIPDYYYCQVLDYLGVTEFDYADLTAILRFKTSPDKPMYITIRDYHIERTDEGVEEDIAAIMEATANFHKALKNNEQPPLLLTL